MDATSTFSTDLKQPPLNTSFLGTMHAASEHFKLGWTDPELFVCSGHAFVTNVRMDLCPSGPYVWNTSKVLDLFSNLNLDINMCSFVQPNQASEEARATLDKDIKQALLNNSVVTIECLDHQVVTGFDTEGFTLAVPWSPSVDSTPAKLKFGSWEGFASGPPLVAFATTKNGMEGNKVDDMLKPALEFAIDLWDNPLSYRHNETYGIGPNAYTHWLKAIDDGFGNQHGAWWNGTVWSECKMMAARFFDEVAPAWLDQPKIIADLASHYQEAAGAMMEASNMNLQADLQKAAVRHAERAETAAVNRLRELLAVISQ